MQVLAACGPGEEARSQSQRITFTQHFCGEVKHAYGHKQQSISVKRIFQNLRKTTARFSPSLKFCTLGGVRPIVIPMQKLSASNIPLKSAQPAGKHGQDCRLSWTLKSLML